MKIAVENWEAYNEGLLMMKWFNIEETSIEEIEKYSIAFNNRNDIKCDKVELFVADFEDEHDFFNEGCESVQKAYEYTELVQGLDNEDIKKVSFLIYEGLEIEDAIEKIDNVMMYEDMDLTELAESFVEDGMYGEIPDAIQCYIDYESMARDLRYDYIEFNGDLFARNY